MCPPVYHHKILNYGYFLSLLMSLELVQQWIPKGTGIRFANGFAFIV